MAPNFQSSFIPKEPITQQVFAKKKMGLFGVLSVTFFTLSILSSIGIVVYKNILKNDIKNVQSQLAEAEQTMDKKTIEEMLKFSKKLQLVKSVVDRHTVFSNFLVSLASSTVNSVSFNNLQYGGEQNKDLTVNLDGRAPSYGTVALQEDVFKKNKFWKTVNISDLKLGDDGFVSFSVNLTIDQKISLYDVPNDGTKNSSSTSSKINDDDISDLEIKSIDDFGDIDAELKNL